MVESVCNVEDQGLIPGLGRSSGEANGYSSIFAWRIPCTEEPGRLSPWGCKELDMTEELTLSLSLPKGRVHMS